MNNAFELLTEDKSEIENYEICSTMMNAIIDVIEAKKWTQKEAGEKLGVYQPRISDLKHGKISKFSVDMLMGMLSKLGFSFSLKYSINLHGDLSLSMDIT